MLKSLYVDGETPMHRLSARTKLLTLIFVSLVLFFVSSLTILIPCVVVAAALYLALGMPWREALGRIDAILLAIAVLALATWYFNSPHEALALTFRILALVLLAAAITATTTIDAFMDEITIWLAPLEKIGLVRAADVGLALGLVLRFVPEILVRYETIREAHRARGLPVRPLTVFVPLIILTLKDADTIALAIDARGFRRQ